MKRRRARPQGCNSALGDAIALAAALEACEGDVPRALRRYSTERVPEGHSLLPMPFYYILRTLRVMLYAGASPTATPYSL